MSNTGVTKNRRRALVFPREHGAWGLLLVPLATGAAAGRLAGGQLLPVAPLAFAALALFWLRTPVESWLGTTPVRAKPGVELRMVRRMALALTVVSGIALWHALRTGPAQALGWIGGGAAAAFLAQTFLKTARPARTAAQMIGAAGLSAAAPAAYVAATGQWSAMAGTLWIANWLFAANQIHFVHLRIHGSRALTRPEKLKAGRAFLAGQLALMALLALASGSPWFGWTAALAFVPALVRGFAWFAVRPAPLAIRTLGWTELAQSAAFAVLLIWGLAAAPLHVHAAVHGQHLPGNVSGIVARQELHRARHVFRRADALQRDGG